ncbi:MAG: succinyl-diaminopimelate desuccinylase [Acidimicrobiales bacterium]|nr:succinyl-diaminopimelate desuccinylase [Acidimicrobiales bacterium]
MTEPDLLALTAELVDIPSVSLDEGAITDHLEAALRELPHVGVERIGANLVARTALGLDHRVVLAGHTDTVPADGNERARVDGDVLWGLGAADMKGGLAVMLALARTLPDPAVDVTWVFYAGEEVASEHNGLALLVRDRPDLVAGDVAILGEPTGAEIEAGCQGTLRVDVRLRGVRAHSARPWMGRNAVHRLGAVLRTIEAVPERRPVIDGCEFREALQAVAVSGGVAGNVVPDLATLTLNRRFAPDRTVGEAEAELRALLAPHLEDGDEVEVVDAAPAAAPGLGHPVLRRLIDEHKLEVRAKLGWTDVARFTQLGIPACNLGPGDATLAHAADERVDRASLDRTYAVLRALLS